MDYLYLGKVTSEIEQFLKKARISEVYLSGKKLSIAFGKFYLNCYFGVPNAFFLSSNPITQERFPHLNPLKGSYLKEISMPYKDRVVELSLVKILSPTQFEKYYLVLEITGKNANLFLLDSERKIKFMLRPTLSSVRELSLKEEYQPPPLDKRPFEELSFGQVTPEGIEKSLYKYALFLSPLNSREIAAIYREVGDLKRAYQLFMERHRNSTSAYLYYKNGKPAYLTTFPYLSLSGLECKEFSGELSYSRAWEKFYREKVLKGEVESLKARLIERLEKRKRALLKELSSLKGEEELLREAEEKRKFGELLKVNLHKVRPGMEEVEVYDFERGEKVTVPLEPSLSPHRNLESYFKAYRKLKRKAEVSSERRKEIESELSFLENLTSVISSLEDLEKLRELSGEFSRKDNVKNSLSFKTFTLPTGKKVIVGRSARENEIISLKLSNPWDLWFHAKDIPGSHVVLKLKRGEEPTEEDIFLAASAAAYFSKGRNSGKVPVDYTLVKRLKKPPKSPVGFVTYSGEKTVWVKPEAFEEVLKPPKEGAEEVPTGKKR